MFHTADYVTFHSTRPFDEVLDKVEAELEPLGAVRINKKGDVTIRANHRFSAFAWELEIEGVVEKRKGEDRYTLDLDAVFNPTVLLVLGIFIPLGVLLVILFLMAQGELQKTMKRCLREVRDILDERA